jgi:hypothetical protein
MIKRELFSFNSGSSAHLHPGGHVRELYASPRIFRSICRSHCPPSVVEVRKVDLHWAIFPKLKSKSASKTAAQA